VDEKTTTPKSSSSLQKLVRNMAPPSQRRLAHLTAPWIEDYVVETLTTSLSSNNGGDGDCPTIRPQIGQITQRPDQWGQTFVSDGQYMVLVRLPVMSSSPSTTSTSAEETIATIRPGQLYRLVDYEMVLDDASDATVIQSWNKPFRNATVFGREKKAIHLSVTSFHRVGGLLLDNAESYNNILMGNPQTLTVSVAIQRVLKSLPRSDLILRRRNNEDIVAAKAIAPTAGPSSPLQRQRQTTVPLGNVAEAWQNKEMLAAIFDDDDDDDDEPSDSSEADATLAAGAQKNDHDDSPMALEGDGGGAAAAGQPQHQQWKSKTDHGDYVSANRTIFETQQQNEEDEAQEEEEEATNNQNMGIDAVLMEDDEEDDEEENHVEDPPNLIRNKKKNATKDDDDDDDDQDSHGVKDDLLDVDEDDATPTIHNHKQRRPFPPPPLRLYHHAGEFVRAWMSKGAAEQVARKKRRMEASLSQSPFSPEKRQYAGDGIRAWLHQSELMQHGGDLDY
jgi:hypothetical protein